MDLGEEREVGSVWMPEIDWPEMQEFTIEIKQGEAWKEVARGKTIGTDKTVEFPSVRVREIHRYVLRAKRPITIKEFQVFSPETR